MRDIPVFTTENGVASLFLKKIPFTKEAFVHIRASQFCGALVKECIDVCRMAGAEKIFATGHAGLTDYPLICDVSSYSVHKNRLPKTDAVALPAMLEQNAWWRQVYNEKMISVFGAAPLSAVDVDKMICYNQAFCIYKECAVVGIGVAYDGQIQAIAAIVPGAGRDTVLSLAGCLEAPEISLHVASSNMKACRLYESLGFEKTMLEANWHQIF